MYEFHMMPQRAGGFHTRIAGNTGWWPASCATHAAPAPGRAAPRRTQGVGAQGPGPRHLLAAAHAVGAERAQERDAAAL